MAYQVKIGYAPGDWELFGTYPTKEKAVEVATDLHPIYIGRYKFPLPIRVKKVPERELPLRAIEHSAIAVDRCRAIAPQLRKRTAS
jgi:hypothetical protein